MSNVFYKRVILKLSGEALSGDNLIGIDYNTVFSICNIIKECNLLGVQFGIVVGGGNFWRGRSNSHIDENIADQMGMLATVLNAVYLKEVFLQVSLKADVMTTIQIPGMTEIYDYKKAIEKLENNKILIFGGGTGNTHFSTDSAASLRAAELKADILFKATMVDGVYDSDPKINENAKLYSSLSYNEVLQKDLKVLDSTATAMCKDNNIKVLVFNILEPSNIKKAVLGENLGTIIGQ